MDDDDTFSETHGDMWAILAQELAVCLIIGRLPV